MIPVNLTSEYDFVLPTAQLSLERSDTQAGPFDWVGSNAAIKVKV